MSVVKSDFKVGDRVSHPKLGEGDVLDLYPYGEETVAVISFEKWGQKKIVLSYANLTIVIPPKVEEPAEEKEGAKKSSKAAKGKTTAKGGEAAKPTKSSGKKASTKKSKKAKKKSKKAKKK
jgi:hypothetical protein